MFIAFGDGKRYGCLYSILHEQMTYHNGMISLLEINNALLENA